MDGKRWPAILAQILGNVVRNSLRADKDQDLGVLLADLVEVLDKLGSLLEVTADLDNLLDAVIGGELGRADVNLNEILQEIL